MSENISFTEQFRPWKPSQLFGKVQKDLAQSLLDRVDNGKFPREVLFCGPTGVGKTTIARMYAAKILGVEKLSLDDIWEYNCADDTGIDGIRELLTHFHTGMLGVKYSIFYLDEIHQLTQQAQQALLTKIEPVPPHVVLLASTTNPEKIIKTLKGRFKDYWLDIPSKEDFVKLGGFIYKFYKKEPDLNVIEHAYNISQGSVRVFESKLQEAIEGVLTVEKVDIEDETKITHMLFFQNVKLQALFEAASKEKSPYGSAKGICGYAISILSNPQSKGEAFRRAQIVLHIMGESWNGMDERIVFFQKLLKIYSEIYGNR